MDLLATFNPPAPYDFARTAAASRYYTTLGEQRGGAYWRALRSGRGLALVRFVGRGTPDRPAVDVYLVAARGDVDADGLRATACRLLNLHLDLAPFHARAGGQPWLAGVVAPLRGLHIFQAETLFEALAVTIIEQQIALSAAQRAERWLIDREGEALEHAGRRYAVFPSAARLAALTVDDLTPLKITFRRMRVLIDVARAECAGSFEGLRALPPDEAYRALVAIPGVGHWTAAWTLIRGLGRFLYVGSADVALRAAAHQYVTGTRGRFSTAETDALFAALGEDAGLAAYYTLMRWGHERYPALGGSVNSLS